MLEKEEMYMNTFSKEQKLITKEKDKIQVAKSFEKSLKIFNNII